MKKSILKVKKIFICLFAIAMIVISVAVFNYNLDTNVDGLSNLALANIEALARSEGGGETLDCWNTVSSEGDGLRTHKTYCGDCQATLCRSWSDSSTCN